MVDCVRDDGIDDHLVFIYTRFLPQRVARLTDGQYYKRQGDKTILLRPEQTQAFAYEKGELHFEDKAAVIFDPNDLKPGIVKEFLELYTRTRQFYETPDLGDVLRLARLTTKKDGQVWLTKAGLLVFHKDPRTIIPGSFARYFRYDGRDNTIQSCRTCNLRYPSLRHTAR